MIMQILRRRFLLKLLFIVSLICLLLLFYQMPNIVGKFRRKSAFSFGATESYKCEFDDRVIRRVKSPFPGVAVEVSCPFLDRVRVFNVALDHLRLAHLTRRNSTDWTNISAHENIKLIGGAGDDFLQRLENFSQVETVFLPWIRNENKVWTSLEDSSNILISKYFEWTGDPELCRWIKTPNVHMYHIAYNRTCISDIQETRNPQSLRPLELNFKPLGRGIYWPNNGASYPSHFYHEPPPVAFYVHLIQDSIVTPYSEVWSKDMYLVQQACTYRTNKRPPQFIEKLPMYDEVMALSQFWGDEIFHGIIEVLPRYSLFVDFLRRNPQVKIFLTETHGIVAELLKILGISNNRIISGTTRAKLLYLPRSTTCGNANAQEIQHISLLFRNHISEKLRAERRDKIILIRRSGERKFTDQKSIERMVKETAIEHGLRYELFPDDPVPSLNHTMLMFHSAVMVVAPHGAGLSNIIFSQPGTYVIEGVCNPPLTNLCYLRLSRLLGHHWHGFLSEGGCLSVINVPVSTLKTLIDRHLEFLKT